MEIDDQCRGTSIKEKDHLAGLLTRQLLNRWQIEAIVKVQYQSMIPKKNPGRVKKLTSFLSQQLDWEFFF